MIGALCACVTGWTVRPSSRGAPPRVAAVRPCCCTPFTWFCPRPALPPAIPAPGRFNKSAGQSNRLLQSPVPACHFYVDHRYRILYIRNTKTAGTSISSTLGMKENPMACL